MNRFLRIMLLWLLALALPVQGVAGQGLRLCAPMDPAHALDGRAAVAETAEMTHCDPHHEAVMVVAVDDEDADADVDSEARGLDLGSEHPGKCSACASCCGVPALHTTPMALPLQDLKSPKVATVKPGMSRILPGGLERPPRTSSL